MYFKEILFIHKKTFTLVVAIPIPLVSRVVSKSNGQQYIVLLNNRYFPFAYILDDGSSYSSPYTFDEIEDFFEVIGYL